MEFQNFSYSGKHKKNKRLKQVKQKNVCPIYIVERGRAADLS